MAADVSINWFAAQMVLCIVAFFLGRSLARVSMRLAEVSIALVFALSLAWALRDHALDALSRSAPLWALVYFEGTLIVPPFMLMAGALTERVTAPRQKRLGALAGVFGLVYFAFNGAWMVSPAVAGVLNDRVPANGVSSQTRDDTCVAAALATALCTPGIDVRVSEAEMARLADVRAGHGATLLRALWALQRRLAGTDYEARLVTASADELLCMASSDQPVLVSLRTSRTATHMIVVYGRAGQSHVRIINPAIPNRYARGIRTMHVEQFRRLVSGSGIVVVRRGVLTT